MSDIVIISGSPSSISKSERILYYLGDLVKREGFSIKQISVKGVDAKDLLFGNFESPEIKEIARRLELAKGVIVGSPVYKASYSGVLKALFDILPQDVLQDTPVLPVMTGGSPSHLLALEYALKPLLASVKGQSLKGLYFQDSQLDMSTDNPIVDEDMLNRTNKQLKYFLGKIRQEQPVF
ncbi:NADPH-dependent FMN reductase [Oceanobacillus sp. Castelsardo]|uniref:NADPH-dependent FMN reductase n=1 Tax=Oceanobacillus sp. Castelsardo TaxID=1851204 RepID=UPI0008398DD8|nr:NADPH-dependent FMN reductase [Oceanobacillus sp. Castelsardo]